MEEGRRVEESGEERKNGEEMELRDEEQLRRVVVVPVAELMSEDSFHFFRPRLFDQGIKDDNVFALPKCEPARRG